MPLLSGLLSLWLGADANWDLFNYHLYGPFALLHGKLGIDLAPAGIQTYFNPLLDLPYYLMARHWPAPAAGFVMGLLHGLNFVLLYGIAREVLRELPERERRRAALLLAAAGCLTANFLSELGNSMGDDTTALFVLGSFWLLLAGWDRLGKPWLPLAAGVLLGLGVGLKLTNAVYAVALCLGLLALPLAWPARLRAGFAFGAGVLAGLALTAGFWFTLMWRDFGNPLFPQFSALFPNPLVHAIGVADGSWRPKGVLDALLWPFLTALDSRRAGQLDLHQAIWPLAYVLYLCWAIRRLRHGPAAAPAPRERLILIVLPLAYLAWLALFGVYRYLVPAELLAPLTVFLLWRRLLDQPRAARAAAWSLSLATLLVLAGGVSTWGHEPWSARMLRADTPALVQPDKTTVAITGTDPAYAWLALFFPPGTAFVGLGGNFPAAPAYYVRAHAIAAARGGPVYAVVEAHADARAASVARADAAAARWGFEGGERGCALLGWALSRFHLHAQLAAPVSPDRRCSLAGLPEDRQDLAGMDRASVVRMTRVLARAGLGLEPDTCVRRTAWLGQGAHLYQWCEVKLGHAPRGGKQAAADGD